MALCPQSISAVDDCTQTATCAKSDHIYMNTYVYSVQYCAVLPTIVMVL